MNKRIAFFDTKPYDKSSFDKVKGDYEIVYFEEKLNEKTAPLVKGFDAVCAFVNDDINRQVLLILKENGVQLLAMRSTGYNNVDVSSACEHLHVVRVPSYSPYAIAEHAMALLQTLNRKIHKSYIRTRDFNFSLVGLTGIVLHGKTIGIIGTGAIGQALIKICQGYGMNILAYDPYPKKDLNIQYVDLMTLLENSDVVSLHCPLSKDTYHLINKETIQHMKKGAYFINTSRGALVDSGALLEALNNGHLRGAGLDVYEEESELFFEDRSLQIVQDDILSLLVSRPNVIITSHQAFLTEEALMEIARVTIQNFDEFFHNRPLSNEICYRRN